jgi:hypothetical protein
VFLVQVARGSGVAVLAHVEAVEHGKPLRPAFAGGASTAASLMPAAFASLFAFFMTPPQAQLPEAGASGLRAPFGLASFGAASL